MNNEEMAKALARHLATNHADDLNIAGEMQEEAVAWLVDGIELFLNAERPEQPKAEAVAKALAEKYGIWVYHRFSLSRLAIRTADTSKGKALLVSKTVAALKEAGLQ
jgi:hypothetical protein